MLGSAIPRRWLLSLALVGLISIMVASYTTVWSDPALAVGGDTDGTAPGTGTGTDGFTGSEKLGDVLTLPQGIVVNPGDSRFISATLKDENGVTRTSFPDTTFKWEVVSGSGISIVGADNTRSVTFQANSTGSPYLQLTVTQGATTQTQAYKFVRLTNIQVAAPDATPTPITPPTNPGPVPTSIPNSGGVVAPESPILISPDGVQSGTNPENSSLSSSPVVYVQTGSVSNFFGISIDELDPETLPNLPDGYIFGSSATEIKFMDTSGAVQSNFRLLRSARVCLPTSSDDLTNAKGGFTGVHILRYNDVVLQWVPLNTSYNTITGQACAQSSNFSIFALGLSQLEATPGTGETPATGDWTPTAGMIAFASLLGVVLVGGGVFTMSRARRAGQEE